VSQGSINPHDAISLKVKGQRSRSNMPSFIRYTYSKCRWQFTMTAMQHSFAVLKWHNNYNKKLSYCKESVHRASSG